MLYLHPAKEKNFKSNGLALYETTKAIVEEELNGDFQLKLSYPKSDSLIFLEIEEDKIIFSPTAEGYEPFRIWDIQYNENFVEVSAEHITFDVMSRKVNPINIHRNTCSLACGAVVQNLYNGMLPYTLTSNILEYHTFTTDKPETLYKILMDGKHSLIGIWDAELKRTGVNIELLERRGKDTNISLTPKHNILSYQGKNSLRSVVTSIHVKSTYKTEPMNKDERPIERTIEAVVNSPLHEEYGYTHEAFYENNDLKSERELIEWAKFKFEHEQIDRIPRELNFDAALLEGQEVRLGDTVLVKILDYKIDTRRKATKVVYDALAKKIVNVTFSTEKSYGISNFGSQLSDTIEHHTKKNDGFDKALENANKAFDDKFEKEKERIALEISEYIAKSEAFNRKISDEIDEKLQSTHEETDKLIEDFFDTDPKIRKLKESVNKNYDELQALLELVGEKNGQVKYNKNRLNGSTEHLLHLTDEDLTISHNGVGFEVGREYTISWSATCIPKAQKVVKFKLHSTATLDDDTALGILKATVKSLATHPRQPKINFELTHAAQSESVYQDTYTVEVTGDFYERSTQSVEVTDADSQEVLLNITFKKVVDGNAEEKFFGTWSENDYIIFDGRDGQ